MKIIKMASERAADVADAGADAATHCSMSGDKDWAAGKFPTMERGHRK